MKYTNDEIKKRRNRENKICRVISIIIYILLFPLIIYNISLIVQSVVHPNETPSFFGIKTYVIVSGSMQPEYDIGDIVIVKKVEEEDIKKDDVISYRNGQTVVTHRVIEENEVNNKKQFKTKGDNNNTEDIHEVTIDLIEGKVVGKVSKIGKLSIMLQDKISIIIIILLFYIYLVRSDKVKKRNERRKEKRIAYEKKNSEKE